MTSSRDCEMLRPSLVALAYEEPHPERRILLDHLPRCPSCRQELTELRAVRGWVEAALAPRPGRGCLSLDSVPALAWRLVPSFAAVALAAALFMGGRGEVRAPHSRGPGPKPLAGSRVPLASMKAPPAALAFGGEEMDRHLEWVGMDIRTLEALGGASW